MTVGLLSFVGFLSGCRGSTALVGNLTAMAIVVFMMWSTLNMNR
jgi:hypothetical protein